MAKRYYIPIKKINEDEFIIFKNIHLELLIKGCYGFYANIVNSMHIASPEAYVEKKEFVIMIQKLLDDNEKCSLSKEEIHWLKEWIDIIITMILEIETADLKNKNIKRLMKTAENFIYEIKNVLSSENINTNVPN